MNYFFSDISIYFQKNEIFLYFVFFTAPFLCDFNRTILSQHQVCDGLYDCADLADEHDDCCEYYQMLIGGLLVGGAADPQRVSQ